MIFHHSCVTASKPAAWYFAMRFTDNFRHSTKSHQFPPLTLRMAQL
ncbi:hypothetical protein [Rubritalea tangerina]